VRGFLLSWVRAGVSEGLGLELPPGFRPWELIHERERGLIGIISEQKDGNSVLRFDGSRHFQRNWSKENIRTTDRNGSQDFVMALFS